MGHVGESPESRDSRVRKPGRPSCSRTWRGDAMSGFLESGLGARSYESWSLAYIYICVWSSPMNYIWSISNISEAHKNKWSTLPPTLPPCTCAMLVGGKVEFPRAAPTPPISELCVRFYCSVSCRVHNDQCKPSKPYGHSPKSKGMLACPKRIDLRSEILPWSALSLPL